MRGQSRVLLRDLVVLLGGLEPRGQLGKKGVPEVEVGRGLRNSVIVISVYEGLGPRGHLIKHVIHLLFEILLRKLSSGGYVLPLNQALLVFFGLP